MTAVRALLRRGWALVTPLGRTLLALCVLSWVAGAWLSWKELLVVATACLLLFAMAVLFTLGRLDLTAEMGVEPSRVVMGERAAGSLLLTNRAGRAARWLRIEMPVGRALATYSVAKLGAEPVEELFVVPTNRRAIIPVGPVATVQGDPLGVLRRRRTWTEVEEIYVHPRTVALTTLAAGMIRDLEGQPTAQLSPSDVAFHTLRDYVPGDDRRHVHWKSTAKLGKLLVRQYVDTRRSHVAVLLSTDLDDYADDDEFELAVSCAASVAAQSLRDEQTLTVLAGVDQLPSAAARPMMDRFSGVEGTHGKGGIATTLQSARRRAAAASVAVLCTGSRRGVTDVRRAAARCGFDLPMIVLHAASHADPGYRTVGITKFVNVPRLEVLNKGLEGVA